MDQEAGFSGSLCADRPSSPLSSRSSTPFHFPFPPLATALFDNDAPNRLLSLLQHQSMLTEESLRCRALLDESRGLYLLGKDGFKLNHFLADDMMKRKNIFGEGAFGCRSLREEELRCQSLFSKEARDDRCKNLDETVRCGVCFATFPSAWLLEQHTTLQHLPLGQLPDDKPFICEQCGQSYRYRSAYVKHREQNHRARLPADKLFTCDVCGMQFRYLKSFKKHRLNHALERLHGKSDMFATERTDPSARMLYMMRAGMSSKSTATVQTVTENSSDQVSSSNEAIQSEVDLTTSKDKHDMDAKDIESGPSEVITDRISECDQDDTIDSISFEAHNAKEAPVETKSKSVSKADSSISDNTQETTILRKILRPSSEDGVENNETSCSNKLADSSIEQRSHDSLLSNMLLSESNNAVTEAMRSAPEASLMNLNVQEASILNFLRVDAAERQRERRFACPFCGKCVRSKENLKLHVRKHTGERPFVCLFCGRAFGGKSDLTRHLRIHTGERPYHCEACGKCFARADYLSKHLTTHIHNTPR